MSNREVTDRGSVSTITMKTVSDLSSLNVSEINFVDSVSSANTQLMKSIEEEYRKRKLSDQSGNCVPAEKRPKLMASDRLLRNKKNFGINGSDSMAIAGNLMNSDTTVSDYILPIHAAQHEQITQ